jgi:pheromone receptor transcription factor
VQQFEVETGQTMGLETPSGGKPKRAGRRKINIEFIKDKSRRHITFSKRKAGIMKKAYELSTLTGTQVLLLVASETGHVYTFATPKLQPLITKTEGKNLIQACLNAPDSMQGPVDPSQGMVAMPDDQGLSAHHTIEYNPDSFDDEIGDNKHKLKNTLSMTAYAPISQPSATLTQLSNQAPSSAHVQQVPQHHYGAHAQQQPQQPYYHSHHHHHPQQQLPSIQNPHSMSPHPSYPQQHHQHHQVPQQSMDGMSHFSQHPQPQYHSYQPPSQSYGNPQGLVNDAGMPNLRVLDNSLPQPQGTYQMQFQQYQNN